MADPYLRQARGVFTGTVGSTAVTAGSPVYHDGTDWELADATDNTKYAEAIAINSFAAGETGAFCRSCVIMDIDTSAYTQGSTYYLSATAGSITATRPTGANNLVQVLGYGLSANELYVDIPPVKETQLDITIKAAEATAAMGVNGDWVGILLAAAADACGGCSMIPQNTVGLVAAYLWWTDGVSSPALDASDTYTIDVSAGVDDETTTTTTDGITAAALTVADNDLNRADVSAAFDATGIIEPGNAITVDVNKAAEGASGDDPLMLTCNIILLTV